MILNQRIYRTPNLLTLTGSLLDFLKQGISLVNSLILLYILEINISFVYFRRTEECCLYRSSTWWSFRFLWRRSFLSESSNMARQNTCFSCWQLDSPPWRQCNEIWKCPEDLITFQCFIFWKNPNALEFICCCLFTCISKGDYSFYESFNYLSNVFLQKEVMAVENIVSHPDDNISLFSTANIMFPYIFNYYFYNFVCK